MKKAAAINTFEGGLLKDIQPLVTPNNVLCDALNATLITMQGNENVLQNDMGNGRVETAFLPEGYVPLGTASIGGIIYILSCNPLNGKCQIGSFPSPERNISSDEVSKVTQTLSNTDFQFDENTGAEVGAGVYYVKKELNSDLVFNPGDKFIVYGDTIAGNFEKFYDESKYTTEGYADAKKQTVKLSIGAITDSGKLIVFNQLKKYEIGNKEFEIFEYNPETNSGKPNLDKYRSIVSQPYNIFSSKVSGRLAIIAELIHCDTFSASIKHNFKILTDRFNEYTIYSPSIKVKFSGEKPFIPDGFKCIVQLQDTGYIIGDYYKCISEYYYNVPSDNIANNKEYILTIEDFLKEDPPVGTPSTPEIPVSSFQTVWKGLKTISRNYDYFEAIKDPEKSIDEVFTLKYTIIPCMNWGPVSHLAVTGIIDLSKLNSDEVRLTTWKYFRESATTYNKMQLKYSIESNSSDYTISGITMHFTRIKGIDENDIPIMESVNLIVESSNYEGQNTVSNTETIQLSKTDGSIYPDQLYLVDIEVSIDSGSSTKTFHFYRFMYTNEVFNKYYNDDNVTDYKDLNLDLKPYIAISKGKSRDSEEPQYSYGVINPIVDGLSESEISNIRNDIKSTLSCAQTLSHVKINTKATITLDNDYNLFKLKLRRDSLQRNKFQFTVSSTGDDTEYLKHGAEIAVRSNPLEFNPLSKYDLSKYSNTDFSDQVYNSPTYVVMEGLRMNSSSGNNGYSFNGDNEYTFQDIFETLQTIKASCTRGQGVSTMTCYGEFKPLAYDYQTFKQYGLNFYSGKWFPSTIIGYGFKYNSSLKCHYPVCHMTVYNQEFNPEHNPSEKTIKWLHGNYTSGGTKNSYTWSDLIKTNLPGSFLDEEDHRSLVQYAKNDQVRYAIHWHDPLSLVGAGGSSVSIKYQETTNQNFISRALLNEDINKKSRFTLMLPDSKGVFYPINFQSMCGYSINKNSMGDTEQSAYDYLTDLLVYSNQSSYNNKMLNTFASILNGLYRYKEESREVKYIPVGEVSYIDSQNTINIDMNFKINIQNNINITLSDGNLLELRTIIQKFKQPGKISDSETRIFLPIDQGNELEENIKCSLTYNNNILHKDKYEVVTEGEEFMKRILSYDAQGYIITGYDGSTILGTVNSFGQQSNSNRQNNLYYYTGSKGILRIQLANKVNLPEFDYSSVDEYGTYSWPKDQLFTSNIDYNKYFEVNSDGKLQIKTPADTDKYKFTIYMYSPVAGAGIDEVELTGYYEDAKLINDYTLSETEK